MLEFDAVLLIGTVPSPITATPLVLIIIVLLILMLAAALASVLLPNLLHAIGAFTTTMAAVAFLYLFIQPYSAARALVFVVQLLVATLAPAILMVGLLRRTAGLQRPPASPNGREIIAASVVAALLLALLGVVVARATWPIRIAPDLFRGLVPTIADVYVVALAVLVVLIGATALGVQWLLGPRAGRRPAFAEPPARRRARPGPRDSRPS